MAKTLSKSKFVRGLKNPRQLWFEINQPENVPELPPDVLSRMAAGNEIGNLAKQLFPTGKEIAYGNFDEMLIATREFMTDKKPVFEASFSYERLFARVDVLRPANDDSWDIVEVKSSTKVKEDHIHDIAFQLYTLNQAGIPVNNCYLMHVNNKYVKQGPIDPSQILTLVDITSDVRSRVRTVPDDISRILNMIDNPEPPAFDTLDSLSDYSVDDLPEHHVGELHGCYDSKPFLQRGLLSIKDIDPSELTPTQKIQQLAILTGEPQTQPTEIREWIETLEYPLYFLDFETINPGIPLLDNTRPYQQIPFQFSLHIKRTPESELEHVEFLSEGNDPRESLTLALVNSIGDNGHIITYNKRFESSVLGNLANTFDSQKAKLQSYQRRLVDLIVPFRNFWFYHPEQHGSCSIKKVLPALTNTSYDTLEIGNGSFASDEYVRVTYGDVDPAEKASVRAALIEYCKLDTLAMVKILDKLDDLSKV